MKMKSIVSLVSLFFVTFLAVGCVTPTDPDEVIDKTSSNLTVAANKIVDAVDAIQNLKEFQALFSQVRGVIGSESPDGKELPSPRQTKFQKANRQDIVDFLRKYIFLKENIVQQDTGITYALTGKALSGLFPRYKTTSVCLPSAKKCREKEEPISPERIQAMESDIDKMKLTLKVRMVDDATVQATLHVNKGAAIVTLFASDKGVSLNVNLDALFVATKFLASVLGKRVPPEFPTALKGSLTLTFDHAKELRLKLAIDKDLLIEGNSSEGKYKLATKKESSALSIKFDKLKKAFSIAAKLGETKASIPGREFVQQKGMFDFFLAGLSSSLQLDAGDIGILFSLGSSPSTLKFNGKTLFQVELGTTGIAKTIGVTWKQASKLPDILFPFGMDILASIDLSPIRKNGQGQQVAAWQLGSTLQLLLTQGKDKKGSPIIVPVKGQRPAFKIKKGRLVLKNITKKKSLTVLEGACLVLKERVDSKEPTFLGHFVSTVCP